MVKRYNRLLVAFYVLSDALLACVAFLLAFVVRFDTGLMAMPKGRPPLEQYIALLPFIAILTPLAFHLQSAYRLRRGRSRVDDFFTVLVGTILTVVLAAGATLYAQAYFASNEAKARGAYEVSQPVWALFLVFNVVLAYASREGVRHLLERRWRAGIGLKRILIAGSGELGRMVAERVLHHRELGFVVVGFVDDRAGGDHIGYRGLPLLGTLSDVADIAQREKIDHLYVALPLEEHEKLLDLLELTSRECIDVKVVPDLLQFIALRARLEDLDGLPVINVNDVPLQGVHAWIKRGIDIAIASAALLVLAIPLGIIAAIVRLSSSGPVFYRQERMGLDGKAFTVYKFRSMREDAEDQTGPVWATENDPRVTPVGHWLRRLDLDELPQLWNVVRGDMSMVGRGRSGRSSSSSSNTGSRSTC
jgi:exopolysaccharide biosynthesis polyprenyl glycosylphosphotransferase